VQHFTHKIILTLTILSSLLLANSVPTTEKTNNLAIYHTVVGNIENKFNTMAKEKLKSANFELTDPHKRVNDHYKTKWGSTKLDVLSFMPIINYKAILPLLNIDPRIAGFVPFNLVIHKRLDENVTYVGHLMPEVMLDIVGIQNKELREKFTASFEALDATIEKELGGYKKVIPYVKLPEKKMINYEFEFERNEDTDMDEFIDDFQNKFELTFIDKGYLIAGFRNFMDASFEAEDILEDYDAFWSYSLCHLKFSYNVFDTQGARPEAGLFAPCSMYMYIRKGTNKVVIGMIRLQNWSDTLNIVDEERLTLIQELDKEIPTILEAYGMKAVENVNPLLITKAATPVTNTNEETPSHENVAKPTQASSRIQAIKVANLAPVKIAIPKVPDVIKCASSAYNTGGNRHIKFSKRVPPGYVPHSFDKVQNKKVKSTAHTRIGEINKGKISAYLRGEDTSIESVQERLKSAGFEIITAVPVNKKKNLISIVFTNKSLLAMAAKENRGFIATLRALVDTKEKTLNITNPLYLAKGFLQDDFDEKEARKVLSELIIAFPKLTNSKDMLKYQLLPKYQFMKGMPHYEDMVEVANGTDLLEKIKDNDKVVFSKKLENGATLIGIKLGKRTRKFTKRIGRNNAGMLPYPVLIKDGKAKILDPKYYLSIMYPMLTMSEFMTIATVPDAMKKDCEKVFQ
jgi:uncharacterized protein (DUF302 family)